MPVNTCVALRDTLSCKRLLGAYPLDPDLVCALLLKPLAAPTPWVLIAHVCGVAGDPATSDASE